MLLELRIREQFDAIVTGAADKGTWGRLLHPPIEGRLESGFEGLEKAKQRLHECIQIDPADTWSYVMLGNIYARNEKNLNVTTFYYDKCLELQPKDAMVMTNYAALMMEKGEFEKAEILFKKALNIQDVPNAYYGLALLYRTTGQLEAARQVLETFFTRAVNMKGLDGLPIHMESKNLYKELSEALIVPKQSH